MAKKETTRYAIIRIEKLQTHGRGKGTLSKSLGHLDRHGQSQDLAHPELSHLNRSFAPQRPTFKQVAKKLDKYRAEYDKAVDEYNKANPTKKRRHMKKEAAQAFEVVMTFSPDMVGRISIDEWAEQNGRFLKKEFNRLGCYPVRIELHMDEETPHLHAVMMCSGRGGNFIARDVLGGRGALCELQDRYADEMKHFGLERGVSRYRAYKALCRRAIACGYGNKETGEISYEEVCKYALEYGEKVPPKVVHTSLKQWKAQTEQELNALETRKANIEKYLEERSHIEDDILGDGTPWQGWDGPGGR